MGRWIWLALESEGQRRAAVKLLQVAQRWEHSDPELARALRAACRLESADRTVGGFNLTRTALINGLRAIRDE
jgi:hypothetical protein